MTNSPISLPIPSTWTTAERKNILAAGRRMATGGVVKPLKTSNPALLAATLVLEDLCGQGWSIAVGGDSILVTAPESMADPAAERDRVREQELLKRDEQLGRDSVIRFIERMEAPRLFNGHFVSIFSLMRDGHELADRLANVPEHSNRDRFNLRGVLDPYVQIVEPRLRCIHTGLRLTDIWRYFRHTWTNQHTSTPGRTMMLLVRDRAAKSHPVVGIAALGSAVMQLRERDEWIGWQRDQFIDALRTQPSVAMARWLWDRLDAQRAELYLVDLLRDGLYWPTLWDDPTDDAIAKLEAEAARCREDHHRLANPSQFRAALDPEDETMLRTRAETPLFRSKRCRALADLLKARAALLPHFKAGPSKAALASALDRPVSRDAIASIARKAKADAVGTEVADLTVCGAIAPYNALVGGKLVAMLAVSPYVVRSYHERYGEYSSEIASSMAGRPISRRNHLVFVGTTSLYGSNSSQYNRLTVPGEVLGGREPIAFQRLGKSRSFGTSHLSQRTVDALVRLAEHTSHGVRVNSIFGEGVNPKLRKVRHGLDLLDWPSDRLLQHGRPRIIYGVSLVTNLLPYLLGIDETPKYRFRFNVSNDVDKIVDWWADRWLMRRINSPETLASVKRHSADRPVHHGARVTLPPKS